MISARFDSRHPWAAWGILHPQNPDQPALVQVLLQPGQELIQESPWPSSQVACLAESIYCTKFASFYFPGWPAQVALQTYKCSKVPSFRTALLKHVRSQLRKSTVSPIPRCLNPRIQASQLRPKNLCYPRGHLKLILHGIWAKHGHVLLGMNGLKLNVISMIKEICWNHGISPFKSPISPSPGTGSPWSPITFLGRFTIVELSRALLWCQLAKLAQKFGQRGRHRHGVTIGQIGQTAVGVEDQASCRAVVWSRWQCISNFWVKGPEKHRVGLAGTAPKKLRSASTQRQTGIMADGVAAENDQRFPGKEFILSWTRWIDSIGKPGSFAAGGIQFLEW